MIAVIFEAQPRPGQTDAYLNAAAKLRPLLAEIDGFISIERFESLTTGENSVALVLARRRSGAAMAQCGAASPHSGRGARIDIRRLSVAGGARDSRLWHRRSRGSARRFTAGARHVNGDQGLIATILPSLRT